MAQTTSTNPVPLVIDQIKDEIRSRIGRRWKVGDRLPPINELAREMGVGEKNTYRAVKALSDEGLLASRPRHGTFVLDRPGSRRARGKRRRPTHEKVIHLPLSPDRDGLIHRMARAFIDEMEKRGREVVICDDPPAKDRTIDFREYDADAIVLMNIDHNRVLLAPHQVLSLMDTSGKIPVNLGGRYDIVGPDNEQGGAIAGQCLRAFGFKDAAFVGVRQPEKDAYCDIDRQRLIGFERGFDKKLPASRRLYVDSYSEHAGAAFAAQYGKLRQKPEAIFCSTDDIAAGFAVGSIALGLIRREDYILIGFDGQGRAGSALGGGITTVSVPATQMGRQAAELLDTRLDQIDLPPRRVSLGCTVRRGKTTPMPTDPTHPFFEDDRFWPSSPPRE